MYFFLEIHVIIWHACANFGYVLTSVSMHVNIVVLQACVYVTVSEHLVSTCQHLSRTVTVSHASRLFAAYDASQSDSTRRSASQSRVAHCHSERHATRSQLHVVTGRRQRDPFPENRQTVVKCLPTAGNVGCRSSDCRDKGGRAMCFTR